MDDLEETVVLEFASSRRRSYGFSHVKELLDGTVKEKGLSEKLQKKHLPSPLYRQLRMLSQRKFEDSSRVAAVIKMMGYSYRATNTFSSREEKLAYIREIFPEEKAKKAYEGAFVNKLLETVFPADDTKANRIYRSLSRKSSRGKPRTETHIAKFINDLYPDLHKKAGYPLYHALRYGGSVQPEDIRSAIIERNYNGIPITAKSLYDDGLSRFVNALTKDSGKLFKPRFSEALKDLIGYDVSLDVAVDGEDASADHIPKYSNKNTSIPQSVNLVGSIGEHYVAMLFALMQRYGPVDEDGLLSSKTCLVEYGESNAVTLADGNKADIRASLDDQDVLVEVKTVSSSSHQHLREIERKYQHVHAWKDGRSIDEKMVFFHANGYADTLAGSLADKGFNTFSGARFRDLYERMLLEAEGSDDEFLRSLPVPIFSHGQMMEGYDWINERSHLLYRKAHRYLRKWMALMLQKNTAFVHTGEGFNAHQRELGTEVVVSLDEYSGVYDSAEFIRPEKNTLYIDLEGMGFRNQGLPIGIVGTAYWSGDSLLCKQFLARNPLEESDALSSLADLLPDFDEIVVYNQPYDIPMIDNRSFHHMVRSDIMKKPCLDLLPVYRRITEMRNDEDARLQDYERQVMGFARSQVNAHRDIPGSEIPSVMARYYIGGSESRFKSIMLHNHFDLFSLAHMHSKYILSGEFAPSVGVRDTKAPF